MRVLKAGKQMLKDWKLERHCMGCDALLEIEQKDCTLSTSRVAWEVDCPECCWPIAISADDPLG